jgi:hypothetical protein
MNKQPRKSLRLLSALAALAVAGTIGLTVSASAASSAAGGQQSVNALGRSLGALKTHGKLSPRLLTLSKPSLAGASVKAQAKAVGLPASGPGSLLRRGKEVLVYVRVKGSAANTAKLIGGTGASVVNTAKHYGVVTAAVAPSRLKALAGLSQVRSAFEALAPRVASHSTAASSVSSGPVTRASSCATTPVDSEGDTELGASTARTSFGIDGSGIGVGVVSDSYNALGGAATGVANGELPGTGNCQGYTTPVNVIEDDLSGTDEGRAMLEAVHDLAPRSPLSFATAYSGLFAMADNIKALRDAGAKVIADDVGYYDEPFFQEGPIGLAIDDVTASGVSYFSAAGNDNVLDSSDREIGSYEAPAYRPTACPSEVTALSGLYGYIPKDCHDFDPGAGVDRAAGYTLDGDGWLIMQLQWAEPWQGVTTDLDLLLFDAGTGDFLTGSAYTNPGANGLQEPFEILGYQNPSLSTENVEVVVARYDNGPGYPTPGTPRLKTELQENGLTDVTSAEHNTSAGGDVVGPMIYGHNGDANTISTAAVPYDDLNNPEYYSSPGPVTHYYGPADGTNPASALSSPQVLSKPDLAAVDCAQNSFFGDHGSGVWRFCGTSQAAPHAAGVAALLLDRFPSFLPSQVANRLETTAHAVSGGTSAVVGAGLVNAYDAANTSAIGFSQSGYSVSETAGTATITIKRDGNNSGTASVHVATASGTASSGDYSPVDMNVSFAAGQTTKTVPVTINDNNRFDGDRTVKLSLSSISSAILEGPSQVTLTIVNDDTATIAFSASAYSIKENGHAATITIKRSGALGSAFSVHFATTNGSAKAGSDYKSVSQTVSFAANATSKTVSVPIIDNKIHEKKETVSLALSSPSAGSSLGSPSSATLTIVDNDKLGKIKSAKLSKRKFASALAKKVKLVIKFSPPTRKLKYVLSVKHGKKWKKIKAVKKIGHFKKKKMTVKSLFRGKAVKTGRYRVKLIADANSKTRSFRVL